MGFATAYGYNAMNQMVSTTDPEGNTTSYSHDENGYAVTVTDAENNTTLYGYDPLGKLTSVTNPRGHATKYRYDENGQLRETEDPLGNVVEKEYDSMGRAVRETNARGAVTEYEYDAMGRLVKVTDAGGVGSARGETIFGYDANGNLTSATDPEGNVTQHFYDAENRKERTVDAEGYEWLYEHDALGRLVKTTSPLLAENQTGYDGDGRPTSGTDPAGNTTLYVYDALGRMVEQHNPDGTQLLFEFNANGWLVSATNEEIGTMGYEYYDNGWLKSVTDCMGYATEYTYTGTGQVATVTNPEGGTTEYGYDECGNLVSVKDPMQFETVYSYDENNRAVKTTDPRGGETETAYDEAGNVVKATNADGGFTVYSYDLLNRLVKRTDPENNVFRTEYDKNGNVKKETDGRGNFKEFFYDGLNRAVEVRNELGHPSFKEYDEDGRLVKLVNEEGAVTKYSYDLKGQLAKVTNALGESTTFTYDTRGRLLTETNARGAVTSYAYTPSGNLASVTRLVTSDPNAAVKTAVTSYSYNMNGWLVSETDPNGGTTLYFHDKLGRVVEKKDAMGKSEFFEYDANSRITQVTDRKGKATKYFYDQNGNVVQTVDALNHSSFFGYDAMNRLVSAELWRKYAPGGVDEQQVTLYQYDKNGLLTKQVNAAGNSKIHVYDQNGNLMQTTDEDGFVTLHSYDPRNLLEAVNYDSGNGKSATFGYNMAGELVEMVDWNGTTEFVLDKLGRITEATDHGMNVTSYQYDAAGNQSLIAYPDGSAVAYAYDLMDRMTSLTDAENQTTTYEWDAARLTAMEYPNGWDEAYEYNANGWLTRQYARDPSKMLNKAIDNLYGYDANGNVTGETRNASGGQDSFDLTHTYDALNRLTLTEGQGGYKDHEYVYDSLGNLVRERVHNKWTDYSYNALNQQVGKLKDGKDSYANSFDLRGNFTESVYEKNKNHSYVVEQYAYDATNRMVKGTNADGEESHYVYNGFGDLVANEWITAKNAYGYTGVNAPPTDQVGGVAVCDRHQHTTGQGHQNPTGNGHTTGGTQGAAAPSISSKQAFVHKDFVLDYASPLKRVIMESEGVSGSLTYRYVYGLEKVEAAAYEMSVTAGSVTQHAYDEASGEAVFSATHPSQSVVISNMVKLYVHKDRQGTSGYLTDGAGKAASYVSYDSWGALTAKAVLKMGVRELDLVQEYTGHPYDMVLGLYYAKARMYDAENRRFMAVDPVKGSVKDPQAMVQYTYCLNNPVLFTDPTGCDGGPVYREAVETQVISVPKASSSINRGTAASNVSDYFEQHGCLIKGVHLILDVAGFIPGVGVVFDVANGILYLAEGKTGMAALSFISAVPLFGDALSAGKAAANSASGLKVFIKQSGTVAQATKMSNAPATIALNGKSVSYANFARSIKLGLDLQQMAFEPPKVYTNSKGQITNGKYIIDSLEMTKHTIGSTTSGKSQFLFDVDADKVVLDAAAYADEYNLWKPSSGNPADFAYKAKVPITNGNIGVTGNGELTSYINVYRKKTNSVHGSPGNP
ncbi:MAG: hypothetical protein FWG42_08510 [Clostridiales bacterium]|nr:hypothetical protein [Clostridiales bacterium]